MYAFRYIRLQVGGEGGDYILLTKHGHVLLQIKFVFSKEISTDSSRTANIWKWTIVVELCFCSKRVHNT